jgi:lysozyme family protein
MLNNFPACWRITSVYEGGYTANKADPGNWTGGKVGVGELRGTNMGISAAAFPNLDIKNLTAAQAMTIYQRKYWDAVRGDDLPAGLDLATWDYGVNSGPARAARDLQAVIGVGVDGKIGNGTIAKAKAVNGVKAIQGLCAKRLGFLRNLAIWNTFKGGWSARVANVEAKAVAMYLAASPYSTPETVKAALAKEATDARGKAVNTQSAAATAATSAIPVTAVAVQSSHVWYWAAAAVAAVLVGGAILIERHKHAARSAAYAEAAANV